MSKLNDYNDRTKGIIHIMVTTLCDRDCKYCCNKQYDLNSIPYVTDEELKEAHTICITGGEPCLFSDPYVIARFYKEKYKNIKNVYLYTNAKPYWEYVTKNREVQCFIDGINLSIKSLEDLVSFKEMNKCNDERLNHWKNKSNRLYIFNDIDLESKDFKVVKREWQPEFVAANDSIFRKI